MNEAFGSKSTVATIGGAKETLVFGNRYTLRHGDDLVLRDVLLVERAANGDLVFFRTDLAGRTSDRAEARYRVRPSTIDSIVAQPPGARPDGIGATAYVTWMDSMLGSAYGAFVSSDEGQAALAEAAKEDQAARNGKPAPRGKGIVATGIGGILGGTASAASVLAELVDEGVLPDPSEIVDQPVVNAAEREVDLDPVLSKPLPLPKLTKRGKAKLAAAGADPEVVESSETVEEVAAKSKGRPYAERNQVWRCGSCKRRTRAPICENGHPPVAAPAGKRREDRGSK